MQDIVSGPTPDTIWADKYKQFGGKYVISGDCKIAYKPHEAVAFIDNGLITVFPSEHWGLLKLHAHAAVVTFHWPAILETFECASDGTCWRLPLIVKDADVVLRRTKLEPLVIPESVLAQARDQPLIGKQAGVQ